MPLVVKRLIAAGKGTAFCVALALTLCCAGLRAQVPPDHVVSRVYNQSLGVDCDHCHAVTDFADTSKPTFDFARRMERMVRGLNDGPLRELGGISCWSCHRGHAIPARLPRADWE